VGGRSLGRITRAWKSNSHSASNHAMDPAHLFDIIPRHLTPQRARRVSGFATSLGGSPVHHAESSSSSYGLAVRLPLVPPRITATQLCSATGRRRFAWKGLTPFRRNALAGARVHKPCLRFPFHSAKIFRLTDNIQCFCEQEGQQRKQGLRTPESIKIIGWKDSIHLNRVPHVNYGLSRSKIHFARLKIH